MYRAVYRIEINDLPYVVCLSVTDEVQTCDTKRGLSERRPTGFRIQPGDVSVLVVTTIAKHQMGNTTGVVGVVVYRERSLVGMDVTVHHDINSVLQHIHSSKFNQNKVHCYNSTEKKSQMG